MVVANGGAQVPWSDVLIEAANNVECRDREVRHPAIVYLAKGKGGGEPTAAYEEDLTGRMSKDKTQILGGKSANMDESPRLKKKTKAEKAAAWSAALSPGAASPGGGGGGQSASPLATQAPRWEAHPRKKGQFFSTGWVRTNNAFTRRHYY